MMVTRRAANAGSPLSTERERLDALHGYAILNTEPEVAFDDITRIAAQVCRAPIAVVNFIGDGRQWFKSEIGLGVRETPLDVSICVHAIRNKGLFVVRDTTRDPRFASNPLVTGEPNLRFYAGVPLETPEGLPLGTLCVLDTKARADGVTLEQANTLLALARSVMRELELRKLNKALAEKSELLASTLDNADQGILMVDAQGHVVVCNERTIHLLDLPPAMMAAKPTFASVRQYQSELGEFASAGQTLAAAVEQQHQINPNLCYERKRPNGTVLEVRTVPLKSGGVVRTFTDITARKKAEEAVARSEALYRALVEASAVMVWRASADGSITEGSAGWESFTGQNRTDGLGQGWLEMVHPEDRNAILASWQDYISRPRPAVNEYRLRSLDEGYRWVQARAVPLRDADGLLHEWIGIIVDIHSRKQAEEALRSQEERYRLAARATTDAIWDWDLQLNRINWGENAFALLRYPAEQMSSMGAWWIENIHPEDRERVKEEISRFIGAGGERWSSEYRFQRGDGSYADIFDRGFLLRDDQGKPVRMVGAMQDITDRRQTEAALQASEERLRLALSATGLGIWDADLRTDQRNWSDEMREVLGLPEGTPASRRLFFKCVHPEDRVRIKTAFQPDVTTGAPPRTAVFRITRADNGDERWVESSGLTLHDTSAQPSRMLGTIQDITPRKQAENALREGEERLRLALQAGRMFAWERDLTTDFVTRSENARELIGLGSGPASEFMARIHPEDQARAASVLRGVWGADSDQNEIRYTRPDGQVIWLTARSVEISKDGKPNRLIGVTFDITERKAAEDELWRMANQDPLTGLVNRTLFQKRLATALDLAKETGTSVSLMIIDLDDFKSVNDTLGHDAGDALLKETGKRLLTMAQEGDTVARLGGDEFALLLPSMSLESAGRFAETLIERLRATFVYQGRALSTKASMGVSSFPEHHREPAELMKDADLALYRAKAKGRNRFVVYTEAAREAMEQRVRVVAEVRDALDSDQFVPFYQPKVCFTTGRIVGFEALARWQHPSRGVLTPSYFHPAFSDPELAVTMGERTIRRVAGDIRSWLDQGLHCGRVAVNFSAAEFSDPNLARHVLGALARAGVPTSHFEVEVTESVFLERGTETAIGILQEFSGAGVSVALDDFGTGFASLTHLKRYPVHHIKVDQSFVRDLEVDNDDAAIVSAVISLGRSLGMQVTAEGVETSGQARRLAEMGCDYGQGYLYAKPMIGSRVPWLLSTWGNQNVAEIRRTA